MEYIDLVVDLQYGSTGKGLICGYLAERHKYDTVVTAWAPNAGHTYINREGRKFVHTHLANGIVSPHLRRVLLGPGSLINPKQLLAEINSCADLLGSRVQIAIHPHAAVVTDRHIEEEAGPMTKIGSTKKGVGAAMIQRIRRNPDDMNIAAECTELYPYVVTTAEYAELIDRSDAILIEGAQGFGLSMYHGFYPYTTSRDVSVWQILADCGIPRENMGHLSVIGTARTYPIRVANRYDEKGTQVGYSGPTYDDQCEIRFEDIGQKTELTTVTKLPRRLFTFSAKQIREAIRFNAPAMVFLNFVNYVRTEAELVDILRAIEMAGSRVGYISTGPTASDVHDIDGNLGLHAHRNRVGSPLRSQRIEAIVQVWKEYNANRI
jgi:adenylosuccinate synthase